MFVYNLCTHPNMFDKETETQLHLHRIIDSGLQLSLRDEPRTRRLLPDAVKVQKPGTS